MVMQGYWQRPDESAKVLKDGWLLTGDLGSIDKDGHIRIVGRSKNVIISGAGKNIYPEEIEFVLNARAGVGESMVYGKTRSGKTGESVAAIIVPDYEWFALSHPDKSHDHPVIKTIMGQAVQDANALMAPYKRIVEWELRQEPFEKTSTRKIKRAAALAQLGTGSS
jgi:long-chain acyl-CoA synthetase